MATVVYHTGGGCPQQAYSLSYYDCNTLVLIIHTATYNDFGEWKCLNGTAQENAQLHEYGEDQRNVMCIVTYIRNVDGDYINKYSQFHITSKCYYVIIMLDMHI